MLYLPLSYQQQHTISKVHTYLQQSTKNRHLVRPILNAVRSPYKQACITVHYNHKMQGDYNCVNTVTCNTWAARVQTAARVWVLLTNNQNFRLKNHSRTPFRQDISVYTVNIKIAHNQKQIRLSHTGDLWLDVLNWRSCSWSHSQLEISYKGVGFRKRFPVHPTDKK